MKKRATVDIESESQTASRSESSSGDLKNPNAVALGRLGGKKGGEARAKKLSPQRRKEIARIAANTRWQNQ